MDVEKTELLIGIEPQVTRDEILRHFQGSRYVVLTFCSPKECFDLLQSHDPDLLLLSSQQNNYDPAILISEIAAEDRGLSVVVLAAEEDEPKVADLLENGANDFLMLPVNDKRLLEFIVNRGINQTREAHSGARSDRQLELLAESLAENLQLLEKDQRAGYRVQQGLMPDSPWSSQEVLFSHRLFPSLILSGDFIDYFELSNGRLLFYIADVSGHGASSAIVTAFLKSLTARIERSSERLGLSSSAEMLEWLNAELVRCQIEQHVTMFLGLLDTKNNKLEYSNAAHFPGAIFSTKAETGYLEIGGLPLGLQPDIAYECYEISVPEQFSLVLFSDGVFDVMAEQSLRDKEDRLLSMVKCGDSRVENIVDRLGLEQVSSTPDDIAVFTVARAM